MFAPLFLACSKSSMITMPPPLEGMNPSLLASYGLEADEGESL